MNEYFNLIIVFTILFIVFTLITKTQKQKKRQKIANLYYEREKEATKARELKAKEMLVIKKAEEEEREKEYKAGKEKRAKAANAEQEKREKAQKAKFAKEEAKKRIEYAKIVKRNEFIEIYNESKLLLQKNKILPLGIPIDKTGDIKRYDNFKKECSNNKLSGIYLYLVRVKSNIDDKKLIKIGLTSNKNIEKIDLIDFHLAGPGTVIFKNPEENYHIPLCSRNFSSTLFKKKNFTKIYDIINISRPLRLKNIDEFFIVIKKMISKNFFPKVLIICPLSVDFYQNNHNYMEIYSDYMAMFSSKERESITLMLLSPEGSPFQLSEEAISDFMNLSKVFTLFSDKEGESRVVSEALLCGLTVVVKRNIIGGAKDYLNDDNSRLFSTLDEAADIFIDLISEVNI